MSKVIAITSGKGGVGKSSISVGIATAYAKKGKKTIILELDIGLRCIDIMLGLEDLVVFDLGDVFSDNCSLEDAIIQHEEEQNLYYIAAPESIDQNFDINRALDCIKTLKDDYDTIIIDTPAGLGIGILSTRELSDIALIVTTPDPISMRDSQKVALLLEKNGFKNYRLIINSVDKVSMKKSKIKDLDIVIDTVGAQLIGVVKQDKAYSLALAKGMPLQPKHILNKVFWAITMRIEGRYVPLVVDTI